MIDLSKVYSSFIVVGIIIVLSTIGISSKSAIIGTLAGYSFIITGLVFITATLLINLSKPGSKLSSAIAYATSAGPFLFLLGCLGYLLYILSTNMNIISDGHVSVGYFNFSKIIMALIAAQLVLFYYGTQGDQYKLNHSLPKTYGLSIGLLGLITLLCIGTLDTILTKFTTDG
jgi:hypothetical protein